MSDEDKDVDIESDEDDIGLPSPGSSSGSFGKNSGQYSNQSFFQADKRAHHNALERKRRDHIKDSFSGLRDAVPALHGEKIGKASRAQILKKAAEYIQFMRRKNTSHQHDIDDLKRQNKILEEQIRALEKAKTTGNFAAASVLESSNHINNRRDAISAAFADSGSGSESSDDDDEEDEEETENCRKKLKTGATPSVRT